MLHVLYIIVAVAIATSLSACSFGHREFLNTRFRSESDVALQIDDYGSFWTPQIAAQLLDNIERCSKTTNTIVVLFIHGWHHNAAMSDSNAIDFAESLTSIRSTLDDNVNGKPGIYRLSREKLTGIGDVRIFGVYVGWRGKSLPMPLDYLTFWGRKAAAERVGQGDLRDFLLRLNSIYKQRNDDRTGGRKTPFMGMVTIGHSFGGQVLFKAVSSVFEQELAIGAASLDPKMEAALPQQISGFGDVVVLLNPALEAYQYQKIHELNSRNTYNRIQTPRLLVLSSATDSARQIFFPIGRAIGAVFQPPGRANQRAMWNQALGEYKPQVTHALEVVCNEKESTRAFDPNTYVDNPCGVVNFDLTNVPFIGGVRLVPTQAKIPYSPFLVVNVSGAVIIKHSGIFEESLRRFLNDYIAIAEGKQMLFADPEMRNCPENVSQRALE